MSVVCEECENKELCLKTNLPYDVLISIMIHMSFTDDLMKIEHTHCAEIKKYNRDVYGTVKYLYEFKSKCPFSKE